MRIPRLLAVAVAMLLLPTAAASADTCTTALGVQELASDAPNASACATTVLNVGPDPGDPSNPLAFQLDGSGSIGPNGVDGSQITAYDWDFGDGTTLPAGAATVTHTFARGHYVVLLAIGGSGFSDSTTADVYASATPTAAFTPPAGTLRPGVAYDFDATASSAPDAPGGATFHYLWNWGDGTSTDTTSAHAQHTFVGDATRDVTLTFVNDVEHASAPVMHSVLVHNDRPLVQLVATPSTVATGQTLTLSAAGSSDPDGTIVEYRWDLDADGSFETSTGTTPTTSAGGFPNAGTMSLSVKVIDNSGGSTVKTVAVTVTGTDGTGDGAGPGGGAGGGGGGKAGGGGKKGGSSHAGGGGLGRITGSAFAIGLGGKAIQRLHGVLRGGVRVSAATNRTASGTLKLTVSARDAGKLHLKHHGRKPVPIGTLRTTVSPGLPVKRTIKLTAKAKRALRHAPTGLLRVTIHGKLTAGSAHAAAVRVVLLRG